MRIRPIATAAAALALALAGCGQSKVHSGDSAAHGAQVRRYWIDSHHVHRSLEQVAVLPADAPPHPPLLVFLHGRSDGAETNANGAFLGALAGLGARAPAVVFPDGGDHSYWHDRGEGAWGSYVMNEVIPAALRRLRADPRRVAIGGISMGGFGAFDLALHNPGRFCAVGGHSPAIWRQAGETAPGAFDDAADFGRHDVVALARAPRPAAALWLDSGDGDPFLSGDRALAASLGIAKRTWRGGHDSGYWHAHYGDYLRFYARALAHCRP